MTCPRTALCVLLTPVPEGCFELLRRRLVPHGPSAVEQAGPFDVIAEFPSREQVLALRKGASRATFTLAFGKNCVEDRFGSPGW